MKQILNKLKFQNDIEFTSFFILTFYLFDSFCSKIYEVFLSYLVIPNILFLI